MSILTFTELEAKISKLEKELRKLKNEYAERYKEKNPPIPPYRNSKGLGAAKWLTLA